MECGNKISWYTRRKCSTCKRDLCSLCSVNTNYTDYCIFCSLNEIKYRQRELNKESTCNKCGNKSPQKDCVFCPYCGNLLRHDKMQKLGIKKIKGKNKE